MNQTAILLVAMSLTLGLTTLAPTALAEPDPPGGDPHCVQVYPWSEFCEDPVGETREIASQPLCNEYWCLA